MIWMVVGPAYIALIAVCLGNYYKSKRLERACVEAAHGGYLGALEYVRKRLCPWCRAETGVLHTHTDDLGRYGKHLCRFLWCRAKEIGVSRTNDSGPWRHGKRLCRASWVINYEWEYREAVRKMKESK